MKVSNRHVLTVVAVAVLFAVVPRAIVFASPQGDTASQSPNEVLRSAHTIFIRTKSVYFKPQTLEHALVQHDELRQWGLTVTRNEADADLVIEVGRKVFTTSFVYSVINPKKQTVVASGRVNSIGGTVEGKITHSLMQKLRAAHQR